MSFSLCPSVPLSLCPSVPLSLCPSVPLSLCPSVPLFLVFYRSCATSKTQPQCAFFLAPLKLLTKHLMDKTLIGLEGPIAGICLCHLIRNI